MSEAELTDADLGLLTVCCIGHGGYVRAKNLIQVGRLIECGLIVAEDHFEGGETIKATSQGMETATRLGLIERSDKYWRGGGAKTERGARLSGEAV